MDDLRDVTAAVLAGGLGTRLRPAVDDRPKALAPVAGRPFLAYVLDRLAAAGVRHVVLCTGYRGAQIRACFGDHYCGLRLAYSQEPAPLGTAGSLGLALPHLASDPVLVVNGDSACEADLGEFLGWHAARRAAASLALARVPDALRYGRVDVDAAGAVLRFEEKGEGGPGWINGGVYLLGRALLDAIPAGCPCSLEREVFPTWVGRGLHGWRGGGRFLDIGVPEDYAIAPRFFAPEPFRPGADASPLLYAAGGGRGWR